MTIKKLPSILIMLGLASCIGTSENEDIRDAGLLIDYAADATQYFEGYTPEKLVDPDHLPGVVSSYVESNQPFDPTELMMLGSSTGMILKDLMIDVYYMYHWYLRRELFEIGACSFIDAETGECSVPVLPESQVSQRTGLNMKFIEVTELATPGESQQEFVISGRTHECPGSFASRACGLEVDLTITILSRRPGLGVVTFDKLNSLTHSAEEIDIYLTGNAKNDHYQVVLNKLAFDMDGDFLYGFSHQLSSLLDNDRGILSRLATPKTTLSGRANLLDLRGTKSLAIDVKITWDLLGLIFKSQKIDLSFNSFPSNKLESGKSLELASLTGLQFQMQEKYLVDGVATPYSVKSELKVEDAMSERNSTAAATGALCNEETNCYPDLKTGIVEQVSYTYDRLFSENDTPKARLGLKIEDGQLISGNMNVSNRLDNHQFSIQLDPDQCATDLNYQVDRLGELRANRRHEEMTGDVKSSDLMRTVGTISGGPCNRTVELTDGSTQTF